LSHFQYCLPVLKTEDDRRALLDAVRHNTGKFFMGTDSAPHPRHRKECECCSAGCFTMHAPLELYAMAFEEAGCLEKLDVRVAFGRRSRGGSLICLPPSEYTCSLLWSACSWLQAFVSQHGAAFYGLARNEGRVVLKREAQVVPASYSFDGGEVGLRERACEEESAIGQC
jgi:dihydroorotase